MRTKNLALPALLLSLGLVLVNGFLVQSAVAQPAAAAHVRLPMSFEANQGQTAAPVRFLSRGDGYCLFLTSTEAVLALRPQQGTATLLRMKLAGAERSPQLEGLEKLPGRANYFVGNEAQDWRTDIPTYGKVAYRRVYEGIDLIYYGSDQQLEYDFVVAPGASPRAIQLDFEGASRLWIDANGNLVLATPGGELRQHRPLLYQLDSHGSRQEIVGGYRLLGEQAVGFQVGAYDASRTLYIDPVLTYSTYLGGANFDTGRAIALAADGNLYVAGATVSSNFPVVTAAQPQIGSGSFLDAFVAKLSADGKTLIYSTYLGGAAGDIAYGLAVDNDGNAFLAGVSVSSNFPTMKAFQTASGGIDDAFVAKLSPSGSSLLFSSYLGGSGSDIAHALALDSDGNAYVTGQTISPDFPITAGVVQPTCPNVFCSDAFVTKITAAGALSFSTFLGGSNSETAGGIALDTAGDIYVTGSTNSPNFPVTPGAFQTTCARCDVFYYDVFVTKLNSDASALVYSTYIGGFRDDYGNAIAVDASGNAYVTGEAQSFDFDVTKGAFQQLGGFDAFVTKVSPDGSALVYSSYLGGGAQDEGRGIAVDTAGIAYVTGSTVSTDFPTASPIQATHAGPGANDGFVAAVNTTGTELVFSTFLGGLSADSGMRVAVDSLGRLYVVGETFSTNFPGTAGGFQAANSGSSDAFIVKINTEMSSTNRVKKDADRCGPGICVGPMEQGGASAQQSDSPLVSARVTPSPIAPEEGQALGSSRDVSLLFTPPLQAYIRASVSDGETAGSARYAPQILTTAGSGRGQGTILIAATGALAAPVDSIPGDASRPAQRGVDFLEIYCIGLGPVDNQPAGGAPVPAAVLSSTTSFPQVTIGGVPATVLFSGLAPNFVGLYVVTVQVPNGAPVGHAVPVVLTIGGQPSNSVTIAVQ